MRLYLKALCELAADGDTVDCLVLNDDPGTDARLSRYATPALRRAIGCGRSRAGFIRRAFGLSRTADRAVCGHLHLLPVLRLARLFNLRFHYSLVAHGIEVWRPYSPRERRALLGARHILCVSEYTRRQMLRFCPALAPARLAVVPNALDPFFEPMAAALAPGPLPPGPRLLAVARLSAADAYKGIDTVIEALPLVRRQLPAARLTVVGSGDDLPRLRAVAATCGVADAVDFAGSLDDDALRSEYAACDLLALPSRREGFGLVYLEAMSRGKPCLGARAGGTPEVINESVGALAEYGNIPDIAAAVIELVRHPRDPEVIRRHAAAFAYPFFRQRVGAALV